MDSGYDVIQAPCPWFDPNGDLVSHASLSSARSEPVAAPVPLWLTLRLGLGLGPVPHVPVVATTPHVPVHVPVIATTPHVPVAATTPHVPVITTTPHGPVLVTAPYGPIPTVPRPASAYAESNASASDDLWSEKNFHAREQAVYDQERKLTLEIQKYEILNQEAALRELRAAHAERKRLKDIELAQMRAQDETAANPPPQRHTRFDSHEPTRLPQRTSTVPLVPATTHAAELEAYFNGLDPTGMAAFGDLNPGPAPLHTPGPFGSTPPPLPKLICLPRAYRGRECPMDEMNRR